MLAIKACFIGMGQKLVDCERSGCTVHVSVPDVANDVIIGECCSSLVIIVGLLDDGTSGASIAVSLEEKASYDHKYCFLFV